MTENPPLSTPPGHRRAAVLALLIAVTMIAYLDKSIFAFAGPQIIDSLRLSTREFGLLGSSFFLLYSVSGVLVGFLANRQPTRWILCGMAAVWASAQLITAAAGQFATLAAGRLLLGAGCGPATAVAQHACFKWYAPRERMVPAALIQVSIMLGAVLGALSLPLIIQRVGWRAAYLALAVLSLVWLALWLRFGREGPLGSEAGHDTAVPYRRLLFNSSFVLVTLAGFCSYLPTALIYSWVPTYLQRGLHLSPMQSGYLVMAATFGVMLLNLLVSGLSQRALNRGASVRAAMIVPPMLACVVAGAALAGLGFFQQGLAGKLALFLVGSVLANLLPTFANSAIAYVAPDRQRGSLLAIHIGLMTSAGAVAPQVVGEAVIRQGDSLVAGFELATGGFGIALLLSGLLGLALVHPERTRAALESAGTDR